MDYNTNFINSMDATNIPSKELEKITELITNPSNPSEYVKDIFKIYQQNNK